MDIKEYRTTHGITQKELFAKTGIPQPTIAMVEAGHRDINIDMARKLNALDPKAFPLPEWLIPCPDCTVKQQEVA